MQDIFFGLRGCLWSRSWCFWWCAATWFQRPLGKYGHYRAAAIGEIAAHPMKFAGHQTCESCHSDIADVKAKGTHAHVNCEACHGALFERLPAPPQPKGNLYERFAALIAPPMPPDAPLLLHAEDPCQ